MIYKFKKSAAILTVLALVLTIFSACTNQPEKKTENQINQQTEAHQSEAPVFKLEKLPEIGEYVDDLIYKRRYPSFTEKLIPSDDYGNLIPFAGRYKDFTPVEVYSEIEKPTYAATKYGLMTTDGEIVVDAIYDYYHIYEADGRYFIELALQTDWEEYTSFLCPHDGSWVIEGTDYIGNPSENRITVSSEPKIDWETNEVTEPAYLRVYDYNGNLIFSKQNTSGYNCYSNGFLRVDYYPDSASNSSEIKVIDLNGNYVFEDVTLNSDFENSIAIASDGFFYGLINTNGDWVLNPACSEIQRINENYFAARLGTLGSVIDSNGETVCTFNADEIELGDIKCTDSVLYYDQYDDSAEDYRNKYYLLENNEQIVCKETGDPLTNDAYFVNLFICKTNSSTIITDINGNKIAQVPAIGYFEHLNDDLFAIDVYDSNTQVHTYYVYSYKTSELIYTKSSNERDGYYCSTYFAGNFGVTTVTPIDEVDDIFSTNTYIIFDLNTGEVLREFEDYDCVTVGGKDYLCYHDGIYAYVEAPDSTLLMKTVNEYND